MNKIWFLSELNKDNALNEEEFMIAQMLIDKRLAGIPVPEILPLPLLPGKLLKFQ